MIKLDFTRVTVVVKCSRCPWYTGVGDDRAAGWLAGSRHEAAFHPGESQASKAEHATRRK